MSEYGSDGSTGDAGEGSDGFVPPSTPHDAGSHSDPFDVTPGGDDVIGSPDAPAKPRRAPALLAMVAVLAVVLAAGAVAFVRSSATTSSALTKLVPAGSYGYLQLDLKQSSSAGLYEYLTHFPGSPATKPGAQKATFRDTLLGTVFASSDQINYSRDIQPWLGNSAGLAVFRGSSGDPVPLVIVASTDAAKAKAGLDRIAQADQSFAYEIVDGNVLLSLKKADIDEAQTQARSAALPSSGNYAADVATLPSGSLLTMWADLDKVTAAAKSAMAKACVSGASFSGGCTAFNDFSNLGVLGGLGGSATTGGRVALGVSVADKVATLTVRELGHKATTSASTVGSEIKTLPGDTTGAIALGGDITPGLNQALKSFGDAFAVHPSDGLETSSSATSAAAPEPSASAGVGLPPQPTSPPSSAAASGFPSALPSGFPSASPSALPSAFPAAVASGAADPSTVPGLQILSNAQADPTKQILDDISQATGLTFPGDFTALLGDRSVIAVGDVPLNTKSIKDLQVGIRSHPQDLAKAQALAKTLIQHVSASGIPFQLGSKVAGDDFVLASSQGYADTLAGTGNLGANPQFTAAMGDLSAAHFAAYVDLSKFTGILGATKEKAFSGFKALGIVERTDGVDAVIQIKLIAG